MSAAMPLPDPPDYAKPESDSPSALEFDFAEMLACLERIGRHVPTRLDQDTTPEAAVLLLHDLTGVWQRLGEIKAYVETLTVGRLHYGRNEVAGFIAEMRGGKKRREWHTDDLAWECVREFIVHPETGEVDPNRADTVAAVRDRLVNCARMEWRTTQLRPLGIDPDDFCTSEPGRKTVQLTPADGETPS